MRLTFDTVTTVELNEADYTAISLAEDEREGAEPDWTWYSLESARRECWSSVERFCEAALTGRAGEVQGCIRHELARIGVTEGWMRFVRKEGA